MINFMNAKNVLMVNILLLNHNMEILLSSAKLALWIKLNHVMVAL